MKTIFNNTKLVFNQIHFVTSVYASVSNQTIEIPFTDVKTRMKIEVTFDKGSNFNTKISEMQNANRYLLYDKTTESMFIQYWHSNYGARIFAGQSGISYNTSKLITLLNDKNNVISIDFKEGVGSGEMLVNADKYLASGVPKAESSIGILQIFRSSEVADLFRIKELKIWNHSAKIIHDFKPAIVNDIPVLLDIITGNYTGATSGVLGYEE